MPRKRKNAMPRSTFGQANSRLVFTDLPLADFTVTAAMREDDFERAAELLEPLFKRRKFHVSEYDALCATQIDYLLLQNDVSTARVWFKMWEGCNPQNPKLDFYRRLLQR